MGRMRDPQTNGIAINAAPARHVRARTVAAFAPNVFRFNQAVGLDGLRRMIHTTAALPSSKAGQAWPDPYTRQGPNSFQSTRSNEIPLVRGSGQRESRRP